MRLLIKGKRSLVAKLVLMIMLASFMCLPVLASATSETAYTDLGNLIVSGRETATSGISLVDTSKTYTTTGGGYIAYNSLVSNTAPETGYVVEGNFELLTSSSKRAFISDIYDLAGSAVGANVNITSDTMSIWSKNIQTCKGVDAQFLAVLMKGTKPDFVSAMRIFLPWQGPLGTVLGVAVLILFSLLTVSTVIDLFYLGNPLVNMLLTGDSKEKPGFVSAAAYNAYLAELGSGGNTGGASAGGGKSGFKNSIWIYFKHRAVALVLMFLSILYLVSGVIWDIVGDAMSMFGGL